jgi:transglutaminase-like putative cysteine protease
MLLAAEVALALVTLAAIVGMHRLYIDGSYRGPLAAQAVAAHAVVTLLRRRRVPLLPAAALTAIAAVLVLTWARFGETTAWLLPTGDTLRAAGNDLDAAWQLFKDEKAPVALLNGFVVATGAAIWIVAYVADWAAFRARAAFEALLPAATLFLFSAALGAPGDRVPAAAVFAAAALLFVLIHRTLAQEDASAWAASHRARGRWSLLGTGTALTGVAVVAGAVTGPRLPGADEDAVFAWRDLTKDEPTRVVPSPLIDIRTRLVDQADVELFSVRSEEADYWRITALDEFDGRLWTSSYDTEDADGELPRSTDPSVQTDTVSQSVTISALGGVWLPAAYEPQTLDAGDTPVGWHEETGSLIVGRNQESSDGLTYEVESAVPRWTADQLRTATDELPEDIARQYLDLPEDLPDRVSALARKIVTDAGATTPYDQALALQDYFRGGGFDYDEDVGPGHANDALESFLFDTRRGYCEQFSGSFAVLGRALGLPTRVAVGYTWGAQDPQERDIFRVRGTNAHAWPEVYLEGFGWVPFEPTPGRGPQGGEAWLGVPAQQEESRGGAAAPATPRDDGTGATPPGDGVAADEGLLNPGLLDAAGTGEPQDTSGGGVPDGLRNAAIVVGLLVAAYLVLVPLAVVGRRALRRRRASSPAARVRLWWRETTERAQAAGVELPASLTAAETARVLATAVPGTAAAVRGMARSVERVAYAEETPTPEDVAAARQASASVAAELARREPWWQRLLRYFDIRQLRPRGRSRLITQHHAVVPAGR